MQRLRKYLYILEAISKVKKQDLGYITNFYLDECKTNFLISNKRLFVENLGDSYFIIRRHIDFSYLYFIAPGFEKLEASLKLFLLGNKNVFVIDLIGKGEGLLNTSAFFERMNFVCHETLIRMSQVREPDWISGKQTDTTVYAMIEDKNEIFDFLKDRLDRYSEQIPLIEEIELMIKSNQLLALKKNNEIAGLLYFEKSGKTSHLKEWHVNEKYRGIKVGARLLSTYFNLCSDCNRFILWVKENNTDAIKIYEHYGYKKELIKDRILLYSNGYNFTNIKGTQARREF